MGGENESGGTLRLLARVMPVAVNFYHVQAAHKLVLHPILLFSFGLGQESVEFESHEVLKVYSGQSSARLSHVLDEMAGMRLIAREGKGRGGLIVSPNPDWATWMVKARCAAWEDPRVVAGLLGWRVTTASRDACATTASRDACATTASRDACATTASRDACATGTWRIVEHQPETAVTRARAWALGHSDAPQLIPPETRLEAAVLEVQRQAAIERLRGQEELEGLPLVDLSSTVTKITARSKTLPQRHGEHRERTDWSTEEIQGYAQRLTAGRWDARRREPWLASVIRAHGCVVVGKALRLLDDEQKRLAAKSLVVRTPAAWLSNVINDIEGGRAGKFG
jgi:hypothetical protein